MMTYSRESTPNLYPLNDILGELSLAYDGESLEVSGPHSDFFGEYYYATLPNGTRFRIEQNGFVKQAQPPQQAPTTSGGKEEADASCPRCKSSNTRKATVYWQCLTCRHEWTHIL